MNRFGFFTLVIGAIAAFGDFSAFAQQSSRARVPEWQSATIFLAEIERVNERSGYLATDIRVLATRILKDGYRQGLMPGEFSAHLLRDDSYTDPVHFWADADIHQGQTYIVFSNRKSGLASMMEEPYSVDLVTDADDPVGDLETIVSSESLPMVEQVRAAVVALSDVAKPHCRFMSAFAVSLLVSSSDSEGIEIAQALKNLGDGSFSEDGKRALLSQCWTQLGIRHDKVPPSLADAFFNLVAKYFLSAPHSQSPGLTWIQSTTLLHYLPWICDQEASGAAMRSRLAPEILKPLRQRVVEIVRDPLSTSEQRAGASQFLAFLESL